MSKMSMIDLLELVAAHAEYGNPLKIETDHDKDLACELERRGLAVIIDDDLELTEKGDDFLCSIDVYQGRYIE